MKNRRNRTIKSWHTHILRRMFFCAAALLCGMLWSTADGQAEEKIRYNEHWKYTLNEAEEAILLQYRGEEAHVKITDVDGYPVVELTDDVFEENNDMVSMTLPATLRTIGHRTFFPCEDLQHVDLEGDAYFIKEKGLVFSRDYAQLVVASREELQAYASVTLPEGLRWIDDGVFWDCAYLTEITLPDSLISIGKYAMRGSGVVRVTIPSQVETMGDEAFACCENLVQLTICSEKLRDLQQICNHCTSLRQVTLSEGVTTVSGFQDTGLTQIQLPDSVETVTWDAFWKCQSLETVEISGNVRKIEGGAFRQCTSLKKISVDEESAFFYEKDGWLYDKDDCLISATADHMLQSVIVVPDGCAGIADYTFSWCKMSKIVLPESVTWLGDYIFSMCTGLEEIVLGDSITHIGRRICYVSKYSELSAHWENDVLYIGKYAVDTENGVFMTTARRDASQQVSVTRSLVIREGTELLCDYFYRDSFNNLEEVVLPGSVKYIGKRAFYQSQLKYLQTAYMEKCDVGEEAFASTALRKLDWSGKTLRLGARAFAQNSSYLTEAQLDVEQLQMEADSFADDPLLKLMVLDTMPENFMLDQITDGSGVQILLMKEDGEAVCRMLDAWDGRNLATDVELCIRASENTWDGAQTFENQGNTVRYADAWYLCRFMIKKRLVDLQTVYRENAVASPDVASLYYWLEQGEILTDICWDSDQDGEAEALPDSVTQDLCLQAVYRVYQKAHATLVLRGTEPPAPSESVAVPTAVSTPKTSLLPVLQTGSAPPEADVSASPLPVVSPAAEPGKLLSSASPSAADTVETMCPAPSENIGDAENGVQLSGSDGGAGLTTAAPKEIAETPLPSAATAVSCKTRLTIRARGTYEQIVVSWKGTRKNITYVLYRREKGEKTWKVCRKQKANRTRFVDRDVLPGTWYEYYIAAAAQEKRGGGEENHSSSVQAHLKKMKAPVVIVQKKRQGGIRYLDVLFQKYQGTWAEAYYRKTKEDSWSKIRLRGEQIRKNGRWSIRYLQTKGNIYLKFRTYRKKNGNRIYSAYGKEIRILVGGEV